MREDDEELPTQEETSRFLLYGRIVKEKNETWIVCPKNMDREDVSVVVHYRKIPVGRMYPRKRKGD